MRSSFGALFLAALLGGGVASGVLVATNALDDDDTPGVAASAPLEDSMRSSSAAALSAREIYKRDAPGVVFIEATIVRQVESVFELFPQTERNRATGSGFVIDEDGKILTNAHVVASSSSVRVRFGGEKVVPAKVVGTDASTDLALLEVDPDAVELHPLQLGDSASVQVGDPTVAIGNPFGLDRTLTTGVVSALQRRLTAPNGFQIEDVIQTDAAINPGNSGGPLLDAAGRVIGVNSQIATADGGARGNIGIGFAVPINTAKEVVPQLEEHGRVSRPWLGVSFTALPSGEGLLVDGVVPDGPAARAGIGGGDVILSVDGRRMKDQDDLGPVIDSHKPGDEIDVVLRTGSERKTVRVELSERPADSAVG